VKDGHQSPKTAELENDKVSLPGVNPLYIERNQAHYSCEPHDDRKVECLCNGKVGNEIVKQWPQFKNTVSESFSAKLRTQDVDIFHAYHYRTLANP
jgi:hypothetical protein